MTSRYDQLGERARWYLNNFDELDLADICASQEASSQAREATLAKVRDLRDDLRGITGARWIADALDKILDPAVSGPPTPAASYTQAVDRVQSSGPPPAGHDDGPSVAEAAADDRAWFDGEKAGQ